MKRAVILHGTNGAPGENWFPWLKEQLEAKGYDVWVPQLPGADQPNAKRYTEFLLHSGWDFDNNLVVGHSSGAVEILHLLQHLPEQVKINTAVLVAAFTGEILKDPNWQMLTGLFEEPFDFTKIEAQARHILFVHGIDDPYCNPQWAQDLAESLHAEYVELPEGKHFSAGSDPTWKQFPKLIQILNERQLI